MLPSPSPAVVTACLPIPGASKLWKSHSIRFILVGEMHGTRETPAIFADLACDASAAQRPIVVAVEEPDREQPAIDAFMTAKSLGVATRNFKRSFIWSNGFPDGRSSSAYFQMMIRLRELVQSGAVKRVVGFQPVVISSKTQTQSQYNADMARRLEAAARLYPKSLVIALVGNFHARKLALKIGRELIKPAAAYLPPHQVITLKVPAYGYAWNCEDKCGPHLERQIAGPGFGVFLAQTDPAYDGELRLDRHTTASLPLLKTGSE